MPDETLDEFVARVKLEVDQFAESWRMGNTAIPENWPMAMAAAEWDEQFLSHTATLG